MPRRDERNAETETEEQHERLHEGHMPAETPEQSIARLTERHLQDKGGVERRRANSGSSCPCSARPATACRVFATAAFVFTGGSTATIDTRIMPKLNERSACPLCSAFLPSRSLLRRNNAEHEIYRRAARSASRLRQAFETHIVHGAHESVTCANIDV